MKINSPGQKVDRQALFEAFLLLAAFLSLTANLAGSFEGGQSTPEVSEPSFSYLWGRGEDGRTGLFMTEGDGSPPGVRPEPWSEQVKLFFYQPMDINRVSAALLQTVPGIGQELATRIVRAREEAGGFSRMEDLLQINGIGTSKLRRLCRYLTVVERAAPPTG